MCGGKFLLLLVALLFFFWLVPLPIVLADPVIPETITLSYQDYMILVESQANSARLLGLINPILTALPLDLQKIIDSSFYYLNNLNQKINELEKSSSDTIQAYKNEKVKWIFIIIGVGTGTALIAIITTIIIEYFLNKK